MGCRRMLSVEDRAAIMAGLEAGLSQGAHTAPDQRTLARGGV